MNKTVIGCLLFALVTLFSGCADAADQSAVTDAEREKKSLEGEDYLKKNVLIGSGSVSTPVGKFMLVRNGNNACAIRFTSFSRSGHSAFYAEYDWYYQGDGSGDFTKANVKNGHGSLKDYDHRLLIMFASKLITCGSFRLFWAYPSHVGFKESNSQKVPDVGNEIAPTKWSDLSEVNIHNPLIQWYRDVERSRRIDIPIEQLW